MKAFFKLDNEQQDWLLAKVKSKADALAIADWTEHRTKVRAANIAREITKDVLQHFARTLSRGMTTVPAIESLKSKHNNKTDKETTR